MSKAQDKTLWITRETRYSGNRVRRSCCTQTAAQTDEEIIQRVGSYANLPSFDLAEFRKLETWLEGHQIRGIVVPNRWTHDPLLLMVNVRGGSNLTTPCIADFGWAVEMHRVRKVVDGAGGPRFAEWLSHLRLGHGALITVLAPIAKGLNHNLSLAGEEWPRQYATTCDCALGRCYEFIQDRLLLNPQGDLRVRRRQYGAQVDNPYSGLRWKIGQDFPTRADWDRAWEARRAAIFRESGYRLGGTPQGMIEVWLAPIDRNTRLLANGE